MYLTLCCYEFVLFRVTLLGVNIKLIQTDLQLCGYLTL